MIGISPAFMISLFNKKFSIKEYIEIIPEIKKNGFTGFQPEIFTKSDITNWTVENIKLLNQTAIDYNLKPTQFVAHYLLTIFSNEENIKKDNGLEDIKKIMDLCSYLTNCDVFTIPISEFKYEKNIDIADYNDIYKSLIEKINKILNILHPYNFKFALEILPFSILEGSAGFKSLSKEIKNEKFGINLDTGHFWACKENIDLIPLLLHDNIFGTHLCDNSSLENLSLCPGEGSIYWENFLDNLLKSGYKGSLDIEIVCSPEEVWTKYKKGLRFIEKILKNKRKNI